MSRRWPTCLVVSLAATSLVLCAAGTDRPSAAVPASGDFAGEVTIPGGRGIYLECHGTGSPTVILISGLRGRGDVWSNAAAGSVAGPVFPSVASETRTCIYDRPGTALSATDVSRSDPVPMPRTAADAVAELHELLTAAALPGPYVLVGSSTGGLFARLFERTYPGEVAGMVLVDAISEAVQKLMSRRMFAVYNRRYLIQRSPELAGYGDLETINFRASFAQMRQAGAKPPVAIPLVVISKRRRFGVPFKVPKGFSRALERAWRAGQRYLGTLLPGTRRILAARSGHRISTEQPELVIGEVNGSDLTRQGRLSLA